MMPTSVAELPQSAPDEIAALPDIEAMGSFIAIRAPAYLRHYERLRHLGARTSDKRRNGKLPFAFSWLWPAFVLSVPWMFYRKMYTGGIILVALPVFLDHLLPGSLFLGSGLLIALTVGLCGKSWYLEHAVNRMAKARRLFDLEPAQVAYLHRARGVSRPAGVFGVLVQGVSATVIILDLLPPSHF